MNQASDQLQIYLSKLLAKAINELFPKVEFVFSGVSEGVFLVDFVFNEQLDDFAVKGIEERLKQLLTNVHDAQVVEMLKSNAKDLFNYKKQPFLAVAAVSLPGTLISLVRIDDFYDLSGDLADVPQDRPSLIKLLPVEKLKVLNAGNWLEVFRLKGLYAEDPKRLKAQVRALASSEKQDHLKIAKELKLFSFASDSEEEGGYWLPKGEVLKETLESLLQNELVSQGFKKISTPTYHLGTKSGVGDFSFEASGHRLHYFQSEIALRFAKAFAISEHSAKELPVKRFEWRKKISEKLPRELKGLLSSREIENDEEAIVCLPTDLESCVISSLQLIEKIVKILGFEGQWILLGNKQKKQGRMIWDEPYKTLEAALKKAGITPLHRDTSSLEDGPKIVCMWKDSHGGQWEGSTITLHLTPGICRELKLKGSAGAEKLCLLTQSVFSSVERVVGLLLESTQGNLPFGLAPEQVRVLAKSEKSVSYAKEVQEHLKRLGFRCHLDSRSDKKQAEHFAKHDKVPVVLIADEANCEKRLVTVQTFDNFDHSGKPQERSAKKALIVEGLQSIDECIVQLNHAKTND